MHQPSGKFSFNNENLMETVLNAMPQSLSEQECKTTVSMVLKQSVVSEWVQYPSINLPHSPIASKRANMSSNNSLRCSTSGSVLGMLSLYVFEIFYA